MATAHRYPPEYVPVLSRGKHRTPRKGACFMEFASYLAGERWSDHPDCTHPLLASLARCVNDQTSDAGRQRLVPLIPSVIGLTSDDPRVDVHIALLCARTALPIVSAEQQRVMAVGVLSCEHMLALLDAREDTGMADDSRLALDSAPHAAAWARRFVTDLSPTPRNFRRVAAPSIVRNAVTGIADAAVPDRDAVLRDLLAGAIDGFDAGTSRPNDRAAPLRDERVSGPPATA
jgi:hypothetical protein